MKYMNILGNINFSELSGKTLEWIISSGLKILFILILAFAGIWVTRWLLARLFTFMIKPGNIEMQKRVDTMSGLAKFVVTIVVLVIAGFMILTVLGIDITPLLATAGIFGVALGFGAQHLVADVISGIFILLEDQIRVGDVVQITGKSGLVEKITLRMIVLRDLAGNVHFVRNGLIDVVTNMTKEYSRYVFDIGVAYREDTDEVVEVIKLVDEDLRNDPEYKDKILEPIEILGVDQFADSAVIIKARTKTVPIQQWSVAREFNRRLKKAFDERNIEIPFPHMTLYPGGKQGRYRTTHEYSGNESQRLITRIPEKRILTTEHWG